MLVEEEALLHCKNMQDLDEADETLSLSDLPLYGDQSVEDCDLSAESQGSTSISSSDYFEFFGHQLSPSTTTFPPENFIFCGKIIPDTSENAVSRPVIENKKQIGWKFGSSRSSKNGKKSTTLKDDQSKKKCNHKQHGKGYGVPLHKMPILTSTSSGKARWYLFLSGISRFSGEMELGDIKSRQNRRHCPPPSPGMRHQDEKVSRETSGGLSGLWGVIRVLSCGGNHHPNTMVVGSINRKRLK